MFHLGAAKTSASEWERATAVYGRLEVDPHPEVTRSIRDYPNRNSVYANPRQSRSPSHHRLLRRALCDLGHVQCGTDLSKSKKNFPRIYLQILPNNHILGLKLSRDFPFIENGDIFIVRLNGTSSTVWQKRATGSVILFKIPEPFIDAFGCTAEWELNVQTHFQSLRLDFMFRLTQPPATTFEGVPYHHNLRSALSGGVDGTLKRELSRIYRVNHVYSETERRSLMHDLDFYKSTSRVDEKWSNFLSLVDPGTPVARVEVAELVDTMDTMPPSQFSDNALSNLQFLRYRRRMNSGKIASEYLFLNFNLQ